MDSDKNTCQKCRECCKFKQEDVYFAPLFTMEEMEKVKKLHLKKNSFKPHKGSSTVFQIELINSKTNPVIYVCPFLDEETSLCKIYELRPFDCKIWPFIFMKNKGNKVVLACFNLDGCSATKKMSPKEFESYKERFFNVLKNKDINSFINKNKELVWDYEADTFIVEEMF